MMTTLHCRLSDQCREGRFSSVRLETILEIFEATSDEILGSDLRKQTAQLIHIVSWTHEISYIKRLGSACGGLFQHSNTGIVGHIRQLTVAIRSSGQWWTIRYGTILAGHESARRQLVQLVHLAIVLHLRLHSVAQPNWRANGSEIATGFVQANRYTGFVFLRC